MKMASTAKTIITSATEDIANKAGVFEGLSFFLVKRLPSRSDFVRQVLMNGGLVVRLEAQADYIIADHFRQDAPAGSISYTFLEKAIQNGQLPDLKDHGAGPAPNTLRDPGSTRPGKSTRTPFTAEDDRELYQWVKQHEAKGSFLRGNEIYKDLELRNPRHTYQAWRDRFIKRLQDKPPAGFELDVFANPPPSPPTVQDEQAEIAEEPEENRTTEPADAAEIAQLDGAMFSKPITQEAVSDSRQAMVEQDVTDNVELHNNDVRNTADTDQIVDTLSEAGSEFIEEEFTALLEVAHDIEKIPPDRVDEAWTEWSEAFPTHTDQVWRRYYHELVRPAYLRQVAEARDAEMAAAQLAPASTASIPENSPPDEESDQPITQKPSARKRKRSSLNGDGAEEALLDHKKTRPTHVSTQTLAVHHDHHAQGVPHSSLGARGVLSTQPIELLSSDDEPTQDHQHPAFPTSELTRAAQMQLDEDQRTDPHLAEMAPMSEVDKQRRMIGESGNALTEANLASQQAQHTARLSRGIDLPADDDARDADQQNDFVAYLQALNSSVRPGKARDGGEVRSGVQIDIAVGIEDDARLSRSLSGHEQGPSSPIGELPISSQQEIDDAFEATINWPDSPTAARRLDAQVETLQPASAIAYPRLSSPRLRSAQLVRKTANSAPVSLVEQLVEQVVYPVLPLEIAGESESGSERADLQQASVTRYVKSDRDKQAIVEVVQAAEDMVEGPSNSTSSSSSSSQGSVAQSARLPTRFVETQDIVNAETQLPDLHMPPPPDSDVESIDAMILSTEGQTLTRWSVTEDERLLQGHTNGMSITQILELFEIDRSESAARNRRAILLQRYPEARISTRNKLSDDQDSIDSDFRPSATGRTSTKRSPAKRTHSKLSPTKNWTLLEDEQLLEGYKHGMSVAQILQAFDVQRSPSAIRNRRAVLLRQYPNGKVPASQELSDDGLSEDSELPSNPLVLPSKRLSALIQPATVESQRNLPGMQTVPDEDVDAYIDKKIVQGYKQQDVIEALRCTSFRPALADLVLLEQKAGKGVPNDLAGVWTIAEDEMVEGGDSRLLRKLEDKHTYEECNNRLKFLQEWRDADEEEDE